MRSGQKIQCGVPLNITTLVTSTSPSTHHHRVLPIMCLVAQSSEGASSFECEPCALASPLNASSPAAKPNSLVTIVYRNKRDSFKKTKTADRSTALERSMVSRRYGVLARLQCLHRSPEHLRNCNLFSKVHCMLPHLFPYPYSRRGSGRSPIDHLFAILPFGTHCAIAMP